MQTHSAHTKHLHIMTYGKLVVLPGRCCRVAGVLPGCCRGARCRVLPGAAGYLPSHVIVSAGQRCRVLPGLLPGRCRVGCRVAGLLPGCCRVVAGLLPGAAGCCQVAGVLPGRCRVRLPGCRGQGSTRPAPGRGVKSHIVHVTVQLPLTHTPFLLHFFVVRWSRASYRSPGGAQPGGRTG